MAAALPMTSTSGRCRPSTVSCFPTAAPSIIPAIPQPCGRRWGAWHLRTAGGYDRYMAASEAIFRVGFEQCGAKPFSSFTDMLSIVAGHDPAVEPPFAVDLGRAPFPRSASAHCLQLPSLADRWQSLSRQARSTASSPFWNANGAFISRWAARDGLVEGLASLIIGQGGRIRCGADVRSIDVEAGRTTGVTLAGGDNAQRPHRRLERRFGLDLSVSRGGESTTALDRSADRTRALSR